MSDSVAFVNATVNDIRAILPLFKAIVPHYPRSAVYYRWAHFDHPVRESRVIVGRADSRVVAHVAISALDVGASKPVGFPQQVLVHPHYRKISVTLQLIEKINATITNEFAYGIGFPNDMFAPVLQSVGGWSVHDPIVDIVVDPNCDDRTTKGDFMDHLLTDPLPSRESFDDTLWSDLPGQPSAVKINYNWFLWRYMHHPNQHYDVFVVRRHGVIVGYTVIKIYERDDRGGVAHMIDARWSDSTATRELMDVVRDYCRYQRVRYMTTWDVSSYAGFLSEVGQRVELHDFTPVRTNCMSYNSAEGKPAGLFMGISDVY